MNYVIQLIKEQKMNIFEMFLLLFGLLFSILKKSCYQVNCFFGLEDSPKDQVIYYSSLAIPSVLTLIVAICVY